MRVTAVRFSMVEQNPKTRLRAIAQVEFDNKHRIPGFMILERNKGWDIIFPDRFHRFGRKMTKKTAFVIRLSFAQELKRQHKEIHFPVRDMILAESARYAEEQQTISQEMEEFHRRWYRDIKNYYPIEDWSYSDQDK